jgi:hypothetical protein
MSPPKTPKPSRFRNEFDTPTPNAWFFVGQQTNKFLTLKNELGGVSKRSTQSSFVSS